MSGESGEWSKGGSRILRHSGEGRTDDQFRAPSYADDERISAHIQRTIGPIDMVYHELVSDLIHVDLHWVKATAARPFHVIGTSGMSAMPMTVPEGASAGPFAELFALLPESWKMDVESWKHERWYWPLRWLKVLARFPHEHRTWLGSGHTIPNGDPAAPFADDTSLSSILLMKSISLPEEAQTMALGGDASLRFLTLYPLHDDELACKLRKGTDALLDRLDAGKVSDVIDPRRESCVRPPPPAWKKWLRLV